jgi:hypothetical protein
MVDLGIILFANVTILWFDHFTEIRVFLDLFLDKVLGRKNVRRHEDFFLPEFADAGLIQLALVALDFFRLALADLGFDQAATFIHFRAIHLAGGFQQSGALFDRKLGQQSPGWRPLFPGFRRRILTGRPVRLPFGFYRSSRSINGRLP